MIPADAEFGLAAQHAFRDHAPDVVAFNSGSVGQNGSGQGQRRFHVQVGIGGPAYDAMGPVPGINIADTQICGLGMGADADDFSHKNMIQIGVTRGNGLDFQAGHGQAVSQFRRGDRYGNIML